MKKSILALSAAVVMALAATSASAQTIQRVADPTPTGTFSDDDSHVGYVELRDDGVRACNEDPTATPAGDSLTGYAWIDGGGDGNAGHADDDADNDGITYGNGTIGAGDYDGEGTADEDANNNGQLDTEDANGNGVLDPGEDADGDGQLDTEDTNGNGKLDADNADCPGANAP